MLTATGDLADSLVESDGSGNITANVTGNADTATALETSRTITIGGDASGSAGFDGTSNITITISLAANSVDSAEIATDAVGSSEISANAVTISELYTTTRTERSYSGATGTVNLTDGNGWYVCKCDSGTDYEHQIFINSSWTTVSVIPNTVGYIFFASEHSRIQKVGAPSTVFRWRKQIG